ncbi:5284_t:CDS:1, partial [Dentiscutata heterogama]
MSLFEHCILSPFGIHCEFCDWSYPSILNGKEHFNQHLCRDHKEIFADLLKKHFLLDYNQICSNWISGEYDYEMATFYFL